MPDRETVMSWLEGLSMDDDWRQYHSDSEVQEIAKAALALLWEQEPVKPTAKDEAIRVKYNCGGCGYLVGFVSTIHDDMQYRAKFCPECGKKVMWDA